MPIYQSGVGPKSTQTGWHVDLSAFRPLLLKTIAETFTPKAIRKQAQQQEALTQWEKLQTLAAKMPEEEKENLYGQFFRAHGIYEPPLLRRIFGAGPEPIMPLPKGSKVTTERRPLVGGERTVYTIPEIAPTKFPREALLSQQEETELEEIGGKLGWTPEQIQEEKENVIYRKTSGGWPKSAAGIQLRTLERAQKRYQQYIAAGKSPEEAMSLLPFGERRALEADIEEKRLKAEASEALTLQRKESAVGIKERTRLTEEEISRKKRRDQFQREYQLAQIELGKAREKRLAENAKAATSPGKDLDKVIKNTEQAYRAYRVAMINQNKLELDKANKTKMEDIPYIPNYAPIMEFEDWLADEGAIFKRRIDELRTPGAPTPPPTPREGALQDRRKKIINFLNQGGAPKTPQPTQGE